MATALQVSAHGVACKGRLVMMACKGRLVMKKNKFLACMGHVTRGGGGASRDFIDICRKSEES